MAQTYLCALVILCHCGLATALFQGRFNFQSLSQNLPGLQLARCPPESEVAPTRTCPECEGGTCVVGIFTTTCCIPIVCPIGLPERNEDGTLVSVQDCTGDGLVRYNEFCCPEPLPQVCYLPLIGEFGLQSCSVNDDCGEYSYCTGSPGRPSLCCDLFIDECPVGDPILDSGSPISCENCTADVGVLYGDYCCPVPTSTCISPVRDEDNSLRACVAVDQCEAEEGEVNRFCTGNNAKPGICCNTVCPDDYQVYPNVPCESPQCYLLFRGVCARDNNICCRPSSTFGGFNFNFPPLSGGRK